MAEELDRAFDLQDRVCVVSEAEGTIGRGVALALAREGARVAVLCRDRAAGAELAAAIVAEGAASHAPDCGAFTLDDLSAALASIEANLGSPRAMVNCCRPEAPGEVTPASWDSAISGELTGAFLATHVFGEAMLRTGGAVVHVTSLAAEQPMAALGAHGIAAAGTRMLSRLLAAQWGPRGVRSNLVLYGFVGGEETEERAAAVPLGRVGKAEDVAQAVLFLASERASYVNGAELVVDGGLGHNLIALVPRFD